MTNKDVWEQTELFVIDIDGTFRYGTKIVPNGELFLKLLKENNKRFLFFTNNSSKSPEKYLSEFAGEGCYIQPDEIATTANVASYYIKETYKNEGIYVVGTESLRECLKSEGIHLVYDEEEQSEVACVLVGFDTEFTYEKMKIASRYIRGGADFLATHLDVNCPVEDGFIPDCGSICASIAVSSGKQPQSIGKPYKETIDYITQLTGCKKEHITFIGDRLETDIAIGKDYGAKTILVLGGVSSLEDIERTGIKPDYVCESLGKLYEEMKNEVSCP